jgi:hypothetical protein
MDTLDILCGLFRLASGCSNFDSNLFRNIFTAHLGSHPCGFGMYLKPWLPDSMSADGMSSNYGTPNEKMGFDLALFPTKFPKGILVVASPWTLFWYNALMEPAAIVAAGQWLDAATLWMLRGCSASRALSCVLNKKPLQCLITPTWAHFNFEPGWVCLE